MDGGSLSAAASSLASLLVLLLLLAGAGVVARRLRGRLPGKGKMPGPISIIASRPLGGQQALIIAEADGARFLIGVSRSGLSCIGRLDRHD